MKEIQIIFLGYGLIVSGNYDEAEEETNSNADFEILSILLDNDEGTDITDLLEHHEAKIKGLVIEIIEE